MAKLLGADPIGAKSSFDLTSGLGNGRVFSRLLQTITHSTRTWRNRSRSRLSLRHLDAHMLRDIGVTVQDAETECEKPFWRA